MSIFLKKDNEDEDTETNIEGWRWKIEDINFNIFNSNFWNSAKEKNNRTLYKDIQVVIAVRFHLFPFRTEKLSSLTSMVLRNSGRVDNRQTFKGRNSLIY